MANLSSSTPFLADNDHDDGDTYTGEEHYLSKNAPANAHFKRPIRILTFLVSILSILIFGLLIASYILLKTGPFTYTYGSEDTARDLAICLIVNAFLTGPTLLFQAPILINSSINITMSIVILVYSSFVFAHGWPSSSLCYRYDRGSPPNYHYTPLPETAECQQARHDVRIVLAIAAGFGILIGILILAISMLRVLAIAKTKFWERKLNLFGGAGYTVQFTLTILPHDGTDKPASTFNPSSGEEGRLIET